MAKYYSLILCLSVQYPLIGSASFHTPPRTQSLESPSSFVHLIPVTPPSSATRKAVFDLCKEYDAEYHADSDEYYDDEYDEMEEWDHAIKVFQAMGRKGGTSNGLIDRIIKGAGLVSLSAVGRDVARKAGSLIEIMEREEEEIVRWGRKGMMRICQDSDTTEYESGFEKEDALIFKFDDLTL